METPMTLNPLTISERLMYSTIRIDVEYSDGDSGTGTGFFYVLRRDGGGGTPMLFTCSHLFQGTPAEPYEALKAVFHFHEADVRPDDKGQAQRGPSGRGFVMELARPARRMLRHTDGSVDLAAFVLGEINVDGKIPFFIPFTDGDVPDAAQLSKLSAVEEVLMIGYPIGIWDDVNFLPVTRRGITATHPAIPFRGTERGLVDVACFPGSSGSPIVIAHEGFYFDKKSNDVMLGTRFHLLGVMFGGMMEHEQGYQQVPLPIGKRRRRSDRPENEDIDERSDDEPSRPRTKRQRSASTHEPGGTRTTDGIHNEAAPPLTRSIHLGVYERAMRVTEVARQFRHRAEVELPQILDEYFRKTGTSGFEFDMNWETGDFRVRS
jgi:hypothetical protein